jgi:predicted nucleotidyltransferase component of viral defense system
MIDLIKKKLIPYHSQAEKYNYLREFLQLLILKILDEKGCFRNIAFVGGTALRILYDLNRFSEDLDFCLIEKNHYDFVSLIETLESELKHYNLNVSISKKSVKTVGAAFVKFDNLLFATGLSPLKDQKILIKLEIDQNPPAGYKTQLTLINKEFLMAINQYDLPSLFSGKLHAVLCRKYTKGRDFYDLIWYLSKKTKPNYSLLNNAIQQTEHKSLDLNKIKLNKLLLEKIDATDFKKVKNDIEPFLVDHNEIRFFEKEFLTNIINQW